MKNPDTYLSSAVDYELLHRYRMILPLCRGRSVRDLLDRPREGSQVEKFSSRVFSREEEIGFRTEIVLNLLPVTETLSHSHMAKYIDLLTPDGILIVACFRRRDFGDSTQRKIESIFSHHFCYEQRTVNGTIIADVRFAKIGRAHV